jgi:hypothetical protein
MTSVDQEPPENPSRTIQDKRIILAIAWNSLRFHMLDALPKGSIFSSRYHCDNTLTAPVSLRPEVGGMKLVIHADNPKAHTAQQCIAFRAENRLGLTTHEPHSPDLTPSDFLLFGHVKHFLPEIALASHEELLTAIGEIVTDIPKETLHCLFDDLMQRLE